jgi:C4-dicarboxylate-specific signal transduction histidine kinase
MRARVLLSRLVNDPVFALSLSVVFAAAIAALDYSTDYELRFGVLYIPAVFLATWGAGRVAGIAIGATVALVWLATSFAKYPESGADVQIVEAALHLLMYGAFALLIERLKEALQLAEERFVSAFDSLDTAAWVSDPGTGALLYSNRHFHRALPEGESLEESSGRWYYVLVRKMRWLDGRSVRLHVATDISEAKRAETLARRHQEQLHSTARLIAVGEMASTFAHELNQPLGAIANYNSGCIRLLRSGTPDAAHLLELMEKCNVQVQRAGEVVRRIREFVRRRPPALRAEDAAGMLADAVAAARAEAAESAEAAEVLIDVAPGLPPVAADRMMVEKVIVNLARNALESMREAHARPRRLDVRALAREGGVEFQVADRGCGVPAEAETQLFQPFFSTKSEGMGLGLAICRSIVEFHRGELWFTRNAEGGSTFHFTLPAAT